ncbi:MAG: hypothetical protein QNJ47_24460 [Nostocaceae cyanobacterium]|nr:hypothetical protein [Nostocaceae cyanobacterium]
MLNKSNIDYYKKAAFMAVILVGMPLNVAFQSAAIPIKKAPLQQTKITNLRNGKYQFCTQPDPKDWQDGAGVCLNFTKTDNLIDGYYGYPHSSQFVCIKGKIDGNLITGEALEISFSDGERRSIPKSEFHWDSQQRLTLSQGKIIRTENDEWGRTDWVLFRRASLDVNGFYQYNKPRMTAPSQLCNWKLKTN